MMSAGWIVCGGGVWNAPPVAGEQRIRSGRWDVGSFGYTIVISYGGREGS